MPSFSVSTHGVKKELNHLDDDVKFEMNKENVGFVKEETVKVTESFAFPSRSRFLSLVDTNIVESRVVSVTELGGWTSESEDAIADAALSSSVTSLQFSAQGCESSEVSLLYQDYNDAFKDLTDEDKDSEEKADLHERTRFLSAVDSRRKHRLSSSSSRDDKYESFEEKTSNIPEEDLDCCTNSSLNSSKLYSKIPDDVVDIDEDGRTEYGSDIVLYLRELEKQFTVENDFLDNSSVTHTMRSILVDWLVQVQHHLKLGQETLYLAVSMLDLVLDRRDVDPDKLQLVGITSLLVASKLEEYYPVDIKKLMHLTENSYTSREILEMELVLVEVLDFQLYVASPQVFLFRYVQASLHPEDPTFLKTCQYLLDSHLPSPTNPCIPPSLLAAASVFTTSLLYLINSSSDSLCPPTTSCIWTPTLCYYTEYSVADVKNTSLSMLGMIVSSVFTGASTKYKSYSQHSRLVLQKHLRREVIMKAIEVLENWSE